MEPCAEPVRRTSTKSPQVASCCLPLRVQTIWRRSASSTRNSRPKSATTRPSTTTCLFAFAPGGHPQRSNSASSFAAQMKSFSDRPSIACVTYYTRHSL